MVCCVFQATNLVNNYGQRKSARTFVSRQEASNELYTLLANVNFVQFHFRHNISNYSCLHHSHLQSTRLITTAHLNEIL